MTKQLAFMLVMTTLGTLGVFLISPFWGVAVYYVFAILRPQHLWEWALPEGVPWSFIVAVATLVAAVMSLLGILPDMRPQPPPRPSFGRAHGVMFLFGFWVFVTYLMAQNREVAEPWFIEYLKIFVMFAGAAILLQSVEEVKRLLLLAAVTIFYLAAEINIDYLQTGVIKVLKHGHGGLDNNGAGLLLAMGVPIIYFLFESLTSRFRWLLPLGVPVIIHAVLMTYSRGAMVSLALTVPLIVWRSRHRKRLAVALVLLGALMLPMMAGVQIRERFLTINRADEDASAQLRMQSWTAAVKIAADYPVFGVGVRNANLFSHRYGADVEGRTIHSQFLQIAADNGFVGLGIYLLLLATVWRELRQVRRAAAYVAEEEGRLLTGLVSGIECSLAVFCVGGLFLSLEVFEFPYMLILLASQLALITASRLTGPTANQHRDAWWGGVPE
ncbi:MAG: O-antigen ligase family protein [Gemmataceae bacterium]